MEEPCAAHGHVAPADEGVGGVVVDEDGQVDGRAGVGVRVRVRVRASERGSG